MPNYAPSTIARIGDLINGVRVETSALAAATYMLTGPTQTEIFNVYGRIKIHELFGEVAGAAFSNDACVLYYTYTSSSPVIAVAPLSSVGASMAQLAVGERVAWIGGAVATATVLTATPGITDVARIPQIVGVSSGVGTIGINTATASITGAATVKFAIFYTPMSDGAYVSVRL
jgi:hypothetical protein